MSGLKKRLIWGAALATSSAISVAACGDTEASGPRTSRGGDGGESGDRSVVNAAAGSAEGGRISGGGSDAGASAAAVGGAAGGSFDGGGADGGAAGAGTGGSVPVDANEPCQIGLQTFKDNGYRTCPLTAPAGNPCDPVFLDGGTEEVCDGMHIYAWGHDGRIGCAYAEGTGQLVGGFLWGLPVLGRSCPAYFAGPPSLGACAVPSIPYCDGSGGAGGARP